MEKTRVSIKSILSSEEISLIQIFQLFWRKIGIVGISLGAFMLLAIVARLTSPEEYYSETIIIAETSDTNSALRSSIGSLFGLTGIPNPEEEVLDLTSPALYPKIVSSDLFLLELMATPFYFESASDSMTLYEFYSEYDDRHAVKKTLDFITSLPSSLRGLFRRGEAELPPLSTLSRDSVLRLNPVELKVMQRLEERIEVTTNGQFVTLGVIMPEAVLSADFNQVVRKKLLAFVIREQTAKDRRDLEYAEARTASVYEKFEEVQAELAAALDGNRGLISEAVKFRQRQLRSEYDILFNLYNTISTQVEQKRLDLEESTPLYSVFQPVYVPLKPQATSKTIFIIYAAMGIFLGMLISFALLLKEYLGEK